MVGEEGAKAFRASLVAFVWIFPIFDQNCPIEDGLLRKGFLKACGEDDIHLRSRKEKTWVMDGD
ncbi:MAG TPA: hypothetical protein ENG09_07040 [Candidatus Syntrophoarchaeum butanivorans]|uniref:Uncharacterized protein n=1 Tax=Candidatus Syntropharchaeum butanivorans TaxID=1839936 RepID=A0A7C0X3U3_9EURY|nr:hypothetical protein [Candidatus Syntrophoarchaeum butanivorans]